MNPIGKKMFGTALAAVLMIGSTGVFQLKAEAASPNGWKKAYKTYIQNYVQSDHFGGDESYLTLVDLDHDGIPELFAGKNYRVVQSMDLAYTYKNGKASAIRQKGGHGDLGDSGSFNTNFDIGIAGFVKSTPDEGLKMFKDKKTGALVAVGTSGYSSFAGGSTDEHVIKLNGTTLSIQELSSMSWEGPGVPGDDSIYTYTIRGKKVSKATYDLNRANYYASLQGVASGNRTLFGMEFASYDNGELVIDFEAINKFLGIK